MSRKLLMKRLVKRSESKSWRGARHEWELIAIEESDDYRRCLCGHFPIKQLCILENRVNGKRATLGNCCAKTFTASDRLFSALRKEKLNPATIEFAFDRGYIDDWQRQFALDTWRKRKLTPKQRARRDEIKDRILLSLRR